MGRDREHFVSRRAGAVPLIIAKEKNFKELNLK